VCLSPRSTIHIVKSGAMLRIATARAISTSPEIARRRPGSGTRWVVRQGPIWVGAAEPYLRWRGQ
jgi:hypothetical protein